MKLLVILVLGLVLLSGIAAYQMSAADAFGNNQPTRIIPTSYGTSIYNTKPATTRIIPTWPTATPWPTRVIPTSFGTPPYPTQPSGNG